MHYFAKNRTWRFLSVFAGLACLMLVADAKADTLIEDSFDYAPGPIDGTQNGGVGWGGAWTALLNGGVDGFNDVMLGSLEFSDYPTVGNRVRMANLDSSNTASPDRQYSRTSRPAGISKSNGELWAAFLYQRITEDGGQSGESTDQWVEIRNNASFSLGMSASPGNSFGYEGSGQGIAIRYDNQPGLPDDSASVQDGDVYLMVGRWTKLEVVAQGVGTMWALTETDYDAIAADGSIDAAELDAHYYLKTEDDTLFSPQAINPGNEMRWVNGVRFASLSADFDSDGDVDGDDFLIWQSGFGVNDNGDTDDDGDTDGDDFLTWQSEFGGTGYGASIIDYDELRYGDSVEDVVFLPPVASMGAAVPEPTSLVLVSFAVLLCVGGGRKKRFA